MDIEIQPEEAMLLDWTTAVEALDFPTLQELYKEKPDLLWTPLQPSSHLESDFAHFIDRLKFFEILGDSVRPLYALHHVLLDFGLSDDEWAPERSEIVDFFLEASTAIQLNNYFWGSEQNTVLHLAYFIQQPILVKKLLEKGALPSIPNKSGHLPEQKIDTIIIEEEEQEPQPRLLKNNKQAAQKDDRKPQNVSDRFKRLRELAESPNMKKPLAERQNSTRKYFRPGHIEERRRKVLTEDELELEKQKLRRQKDVELLAQRSAVKNNPLFKKFEQQQPPTTASKSLGSSGKVASAIKSKQALLDGDQIRRNSRVISSLKDRSVVSTSVFRQQKQSESLNVPTLDQLRAASPTFKKSSLNENMAESDSDSDDENTETRSDQIDVGANVENSTREDIETDSTNPAKEESLDESTDKPKAKDNTQVEKHQDSEKPLAGTVEIIEDVDKVGKIGKLKNQESENAKPESSLSVGKLAARNLSAESITKQKKFSGIISNKVKNIINVHEHLNDKEDVEIEVLGKTFAVWKNQATGEEVQVDTDTLSKLTTSATPDDSTESEVAKNTKTVEASLSSSTSSFTPADQINANEEIVAPKAPTIVIESDTMDSSVSNFVPSKTTTFSENEILSEKSGYSTNIPNSDYPKTDETNGFGVSGSSKHFNEPSSRFSEESMVDSLLVGNRDSSTNSFVESQTPAANGLTKTKNSIASDVSSGSPTKNNDYTSDTQKADLKSGFTHSSDFKPEGIKSDRKIQTTGNTHTNFLNESSIGHQNAESKQHSYEASSAHQKTMDSAIFNGINSTLPENGFASVPANSTDMESSNVAGGFSSDNDSFHSKSQNNADINYTRKEATIMSDEEDFVDPHIQQFIRNNNASSNFAHEKSIKINPVDIKLANAKSQSQGGNKSQNEPYFEDSDEDEATTPTMATVKKFEFSNSQNSSLQNVTGSSQSRSIDKHNPVSVEVSPSIDSNWETAYNDLLSSKAIDFEDDIVDDKSEANNLYSSRTSFSSDVDEKNIIDKLSSNDMVDYNGNGGEWNKNKTMGGLNIPNTENEENPHQRQRITEDQANDGKLKTDSFLNPSRPDSEAVEYSVNKVQITEMYPSTSSTVVTSNESKRMSGSQRNHWSTGINLMGAVLKRESMKHDRQSIAASSEAGSEQWFDPDDDWASQDESYRRSLMSASMEKYNDYKSDSDDPTLGYYDEKLGNASYQKNGSTDKTTSNNYYQQESSSHEDPYYHNQSHDNTPRSEYFNQMVHNRISDSSTASESSSYKNSNSTQNTAHEDYDFKASYVDDNEEALDYYATKLHTESPVIDERSLAQNNLEYTHQHTSKSQFQIDSDNEEGEGEIVVFMDSTHSNSRVRPDSDYDIDGKLGRMEYQSMVSTEEFKTIDIQNATASSREIAPPPESPVVPLSPANDRFISDPASTFNTKTEDNIPESSEYTKVDNTSNSRVINDNSSNKFEIPDDDDTPPLPHDPNTPRVEDISRYMNTLPAVENAYVEHNIQKQRISKKPSTEEQTSDDRGIPNAHEINFDVLPDPFKDTQLKVSPSKISLSSTEASSFGKMYIGVSGAHNMLLPLPKEITYVRCVISDGEYEYMSRYEILGPQILMDYECIIDTRPGMIITVSLHVRPDYHVKPRTGWTRWFTSIRKQKEHLSGYVHPDDGAIGQTRFAVDHMVPACHKKTYEANFDCFNSWYARTNRERARREQYGDEEDILKIVGKLTVEMLYLPVSSASVQVPRSLRECDLTLKIRQWHSTCWHSGYLSTRCQGLKIWERRYYRLIGSQLVGYDSELDEVEKQVWDRYNIADAIRLSAAADKVIISLVEEEDPDKVFKAESIHDENNKGFFRLSFPDFYLDCVSDDANESEEWVKTLKSMIGRVPLRLPFTD